MYWGPFRVSSENILEVKNLHLGFQAAKSAKGSVHTIPILRGLNFNLAYGEALGIVGESGSGKSVTSFAIMDLLPEYARVQGDISLFGRPWLTASLSEKNQFRGSKIAMIFQDPLSSLDPCFTIEEQIAEVIRLHTSTPAEQVQDKVIQALEQVGIPDPHSRLKAYPHQLSGGMCQRIMIAMALAGEPELIIADEPTTALDVTIQKQILDLLQKLRQEKNLSMILISHDLGLVAENVDRLAVMYAGEIVEMGSVRQILKNPQHPYTVSLLNSLPSRYHELNKNFRIPVMKGVVPNLANRPIGCQFHPRCEYAQESCRRGEIALSLEGVRCLFPLKIINTEMDSSL